MKPTLPALLLAALFVGTTALFAQTSAPSATPDRLARGLKLFPEADADKDGKLSLPEALSYVEAHPELKALLEAQADGGSRKGSFKPASFAPRAEGTRVFVCAHSFMIYTASMLPAVAKSAGVFHLNAGQQMLGGSRVLQHWNLPDERNQAKKALREGIVDVLTLSPHLLLPDEGIDHYTKFGLDKNPKLRVLVQASWVPRDGHNGTFKNAMRDAATAEEVRRIRDEHHSGWLAQLETQVRALNASVGREIVFIVPVSAAVYALRERIAEGWAPGLTRQTELFRDDLGHPTDALTLLVTYCHFAAIYQHSPVGLPAPAQLQGKPQSEELNTLLQQLAWEAVSTYPMSGVRGDAAKSAVAP